MSSTTRLLANPLFALGLCLSPHAQATTITNAGYTATDAVAFQWDALTNGYNNPISAAARTLGNDDDTATGPIGLGFNFTLFNQSYSQIYITSNGLLTFGGSTTDNHNAPLAGALPVLSMPTIAVAWDDWTTTPNGTDGVYYATLGSAGSRRFVVEWHDTIPYSSSSNPSPASFEAVLYEASNAIELRYLDMNTGNSGTALGIAATTGIRDANANVNGRYLQWSNNQAVLADNSSVLITPQAAAVPEPASSALLALGLAGIGYSRRRQF